MEQEGGGEKALRRWGRTPREKCGLRLCFWALALHIEESILMDLPLKPYYIFRSGPFKTFTFVNQFTELVCLCKWSIYGIP